MGVSSQIELLQMTLHTDFDKRCPLSSLDDYSTAQIEVSIDRLQQREECLARSEVAREQQGAQLLELNQVI
ncbi:hypothetical protein E4U35_000902 [Claviceps purpurea]|nr:hypothetical protein E4U35_000902 [Claviceps purpurea]